MRKVQGKEGAEQEWGAWGREGRGRGGRDQPRLGSLHFLQSYFGIQWLHSDQYWFKPIDCLCFYPLHVVVSCNVYSIHLFKKSTNILSCHSQLQNGSISWTPVTMKFFVLSFESIFSRKVCCLSKIDLCSSFHHIYLNLKQFFTFL